MTAKRAMGAVAGLILFHGAGGDRDHHTLQELEQRLPIPVARVNFPYRQQSPGRRPPDRMPKLVDAVNQAVEEYGAKWNVEPSSVAVGGRSMGGRAASMAIADGLKVAGLVLLSYPLHPQGKPEKLRVAHFGAITCPTLLVQGTRDPFGKPDEFARHLPSISGTLTEQWIDANHSPTKHDDKIVGYVQDWLEGMKLIDPIG